MKLEKLSCLTILADMHAGKVDRLKKSKPLLNVLNKSHYFQYFTQILEGMQKSIFSLFKKITTCQEDTRRERDMQNYIYFYIEIRIIFMALDYRKKAISGA